MAQNNNAVRYRFALNADHRLVDVNDLVRITGASAREYFECVGCGRRLVAHLKDDLRARHFAHFRADECVGYETYLHKAAKAAFLETYLDCLANQKPFTLRVPVADICTELRAELGFVCARPSYREINLTRWFDSAIEEARFEAFKPDVLLMSSNNGRSMFVELAVTHRCEQQKIDCGVRILELSIESDADIASIRSGVINVDDNGPARTYNFKLKAAEGSFCKGNCPRHVGVFVVHRTGRPKLFSVPAGKALAFKPPSAVWQRVLTKFEEAPFVGLEQREYLGDDLPPGNSPMQRASMAAVLDGVTVRTCEVCRSQGTGSLLGVWCHVHRETVHPSQAAKCSSFQSVRSLAELKRIHERNENWLKRRRR
jgi:hypothetical protein